MEVTWSVYVLYTTEWHINYTKSVQLTAFIEIDTGLTLRSLRQLKVQA